MILSVRKQLIDITKKITFILGIFSIILLISFQAEAKIKLLDPHIYSGFQFALKIIREKGLVSFFTKNLTNEYSGFKMTIFWGKLNLLNFKIIQITAWIIIINSLYIIVCIIKKFKDILDFLTKKEKKK